MQKARVGAHIHPKVVNVQASWWYPELPTEEPWLAGATISNANVRARVLLNSDKNRFYYSIIRLPVYLSVLLP
jgi:hypothetical protein